MPPSLPPSADDPPPDGPHDGPRHGPLDGSLFGPGQPCFGCAPDHPTGFRLRFTDDGEHIATRFVPGEHHQGPPGVMHGGLVFTLADEVAAWTLIARLGKFGFTARFAGALQRPVRPQVEVEGRGRIVRSTPRTVEVEVVLSQSGEDAFRGTFTFVILDTDAAERLIGGPLPEAWRRFSR
jgi:acyl-coenzyme A thioesterase PaaI-like protein